MKIHELLEKRQSRRIIDPEKELEYDVIRTLFEAARWAPSCSNNQPWRIIAATDSKLEEIRNHLSRGNEWARNAACIFIFTSKPDLDCQITGRDYYTLGLGLAMENVLLQGVHLGLVAHPIAGFSEKGVKEVLNIPDEYRIHALIVLGYPGNESAADTRTLEKERMPRERKTLKEIAFLNNWENPFPSKY